MLEKFSARRLVVMFAVLFAATIIASCAPSPTPAPPALTSAPATTAPTAAPATSAPTTAPTAVSAALEPCDAGALKVSSVQASVPASPVPPTLPVPTAIGAPTAAPPRPTATLRPAPQADNVGFPEGFQDKFKFLYVSDRVATKQVRVVCGNDIAASVKPGQSYPFGSVLIFESWRPKEDTSGNVIKDSNGRLIRDTMTTIFTMRKEKGFGEAYGGLRNGEWEYAGYRADKSYSNAPATTSACASCHLASKDYDFVMRIDLLAAKERYGQTPVTGPNEVGIASMAFAPGNLKVKAGTTLKWINGDDIDHNVVATDTAFNSGLIKPGGNFTFTFAKPGTYEYACTIHAEQMSGLKVEVTE